MHLKDRANKMEGQMRADHVSGLSTADAASPGHVRGAGEPLLINKHR